MVANKFIFHIQDVIDKIETYVVKFTKDMNI